MLNDFDLSEILEDALQTLELPTSIFKSAETEYNKIGTWLADSIDLGRYSPMIYPQGSFRLGTAIVPFHKDQDLDIDLVCQLDIDKKNTTQQELKDKIGDRLKENAEYKKILKPARRCWTLDYHKQFHLDILPAIPNVENLPDGILLTDTKLTDWQKSNPKEYAKWFYSKMNDSIFLEDKDIEEVPMWSNKTLLQKSVQILKRHRDFYSQQWGINEPPVSMIITTLAALSYQRQSTLYESLVTIVSDLEKCIEKRSDKWWIPNPADSDENFADKWNEYPKRKENFDRWLEQVKKDFISIDRARGKEEIRKRLESIFAPPRQSRTQLLGDYSSIKSSSFVNENQVVPTVGSKHHRHHVTWREDYSKNYRVKIFGKIYLENRKKEVSELSSRPIPKHRALLFKIKTNVPSPYEVYWQITNTGGEAEKARSLRGNFESGDGLYHKWESTLYFGVHYVEAFVIKENVCVARSGEIPIKIGHS